MLQSKNQYLSSPRKITIFNSLGGNKAPFTPIDTASTPPKVRMYVCGLTPQNHSHIGHALLALRFDMVRRYLKYRNLDVTFVQNVTDIDDKILERSAQTGEDPRVMAKRYTEEFYSCLRQMNVMPVDHLPKVSEYLDAIIDFVKDLIKKGFAYPAKDGSVYFDVAKKADYGKLSNQKTDLLYEGVRKAVDEHKHSPLDFALWKEDKDGALSVPSPWGVGRPGWHIECSAMIWEVLGQQIDIHGGGLDIKFPHHENEVAQSEARGGGKFANIWMHSGLLTVQGQKMSKSLGNFILLIDALPMYGPELLRFGTLRTHYRSAIDLSDKLFLENVNSLLAFHRLFDRAAGVTAGTAPEKWLGALLETYEAAMDNDFNSAEALVAIEKARDELLHRTKGKPLSAEDAACAGVIRELGGILGVFFRSLAEVETEALTITGRVRGGETLTRESVRALLDQRIEARKQKDFAAADAARAKLTSLGIEVLDSADGAQWRIAVAAG